MLGVILIQTAARGGLDVSGRIDPAINSEEERTEDERLLEEAFKAAVTAITSVGSVSGFEAKG